MKLLLKTVGFSDVPRAEFSIICNYGNKTAQYGLWCNKRCVATAALETVDKNNSPWFHLLPSDMSIF